MPHTHDMDPPAGPFSTPRTLGIDYHAGLREKKISARPHIAYSGSQDAGTSVLVPSAPGPRRRQK